MFIELLIVKSIPMSNAFDNHVPRFDSQLHAVITGPQAEVSSQLAAQWLSATDIWPIVKSSDDREHARLNWPRKLCVFLQGSGGNKDFHPTSLARIDTKVNGRFDRYFRVNSNSTMIGKWSEARRATWVWPA
jgi:hypothetical protein